MTLEDAVYYKKDGIIIRRSKPSDVDILSNNLRQCDIDEIWSSNHATPYEALHQGFKNSVLCLTVEYNKEPVSMFGIHAEDLVSTKAVIWFLSSDKIECFKKIFMKHSRRFVDMMLGFYPYLENYVDRRNSKSIDWLNRIGANISDGKPYGIEIRIFHHFSFSR